MNTIEIKENPCPKCGENDLSKFRKRRNGKYVYPYYLCKQCDTKAIVERMAANPSSQDIKRDRLRRKEKYERKNDLNTALYIYKDCKNGDRKRGFLCDLTMDFIAETIKNGCSYCGENTIRMTLDRVNNTEGHTQTNVVAACIRCNFARKDMPHEAWLCLIDGMTKAREAGLFGEWTGRVR